MNRRKGGDDGTLFARQYQETMKRLLICTPSHNLYGGVESIINDLCRHLPARGWEATLALAKGTRFNDVERYRQTYPDIPAITVDGTGGTRQSRRENLIREIRRFQPDVVMNARIHDLFPVMTELKRRGGAPRFVATVRVYEPGYIHDVRNYQNIIDLCVVSGAIIAAACARFSELPSERIVSIPGGVHPPDVPVLPRERPEVIRLGYVGRLDEGAKRIFDIPPLLALLEREGIPFRLVVAGAGPDEAGLRERLAAQIRTGTVEFRGWLTREQLYRELYPRLDCLIHCAEIEGVTISPREAMAHGVVPVISRFVGLKSEGQFRDGVNALTFPVGEVTNAAACIRRLWSEPGLITGLSREAMLSQTGLYSFSGNLDAWAAALDRCLELPLRQGEVTAPDREDRGRLARLGVSPWLAQRFRDLAGEKPVYADPGSEWHTCDTRLPAWLKEEIERFPYEIEGVAARTP